MAKKYNPIDNLKHFAHPKKSSARPRSGSISVRVKPHSDITKMSTTTKRK